MREFLVLVIFIAVITFMLPFILNVVLFSLCAAAIIMLLASLGVLPGRFSARRRERGKTVWQWKWKNFGRKRDENAGSAPGGGEWYAPQRDAEEIILPETALRKDKKTKKNG